MNERKIMKNNINKKIFAAIGVMVILCGIWYICRGGGKNTTHPKATRNFFAMDTYMTVTCYGDKCEEAVEASVSEIERLEEELYVAVEGSEVERLNSNGNAVVTNEVIKLIDKSKEIYEETDGAFDITVLPLMEKWGFTSGSLYIPDKDELKELVSKCGMDKIETKENHIFLGDSQKIDFGGIAKGYASDRLVKIFDEYDIESAYMSLGGNVYCYKNKIDGSKWNIAIQSPDNDESYAAVISLKDKAVITSGGYERYLTDESTGKKYHHILDAKTGYPADSDLKSVTIISENGMEADCMSTALFVMGLDKAVAYWKEHSEAFDFVLRTTDDNLYTTENLNKDLKTSMEKVVVNK